MAGIAKDHVQHLAAEFFVIFASIVLALFADDWREGRNERRAEADALGVILDELRDNRVELSTYREELGEQVRATDDFLAVLEAGASADTLGLLFRQVNDSWNYQPPGPASHGVVQSGQLAVIEDAELRGLILRFYNGGQAYLLAIKAGIEEDADRTALLVQRHMRSAPIGEGGWGRVLTSTPSEWVADQEFLAALGEGRMSRAFLSRRLEEVFMPANERLIENIEAYLSGR